jgi:hypothetical protein
MSLTSKSLIRRISRWPGLSYANAFPERFYHGRLARESDN